MQQVSCERAHINKTETMSSSTKVPVVVDGGPNSQAALLLKKQLKRKRLFCLFVCLFVCLLFVCLLFSRSVVYDRRSHRRFLCLRVELTHARPVRRQRRLTPVLPTCFGGARRHTTTHGRRRRTHALVWRFLAFFGDAFLTRARAQS